MEAFGLNRLTNALTDDQLRRAAPSIFADAPASHLTDRYGFLPTYQVINGLRENGFLPFSARQSVTRLPGGSAFARHEVRFRHVDTIARLQRIHTPGVHNFLKDEVFDEIALVNSHDGSSTFELFQAMFRVACSNGLVVAHGTGDRVSIRHSGNIVDNVIEGATRIVADTENMIELRDDLRSITLDRDEQRAFAEAALQLRYGEAAPITADAILTARREEDRLPSLWNVFNVVQENMVKGGVRGRTINTGRRMTTRGITGITQDIAVNRMLWNLAEAARNMKDTLDLTAGLEQNADLIEA